MKAAGLKSASSTRTEERKTGLMDIEQDSALRHNTLRIPNFPAFPGQCSSLGMLPEYDGLPVQIGGQLRTTAFRPGFYV